MIKLKEYVRSANAERSILMSYCASLPFFEQEILPHLQTVGLGEVTVLLGEADYHASLSDYVRSAGIRYRFHPFRLPHRHANFHPKLYLLFGPARVELLVASANLTPSGFQSNLEIVDRLVISAEDRRDARAFRQYAEMLRSLTRLDPNLPPSVVRTLIQTSEAIQQRVGVEVISEGPHFLHSLEEPLLQQLRAIVGSTAVSGVDIVSPFFDGESKAVQEIAKSFPDATIRIVKGGNPKSFNGKALIGLGSRIVVDEVAFAEDAPQRKLHAKIMALHGPGREWLITGSANMSRPAWLTRADNRDSPGNVEAVVVREVELGTMATLLDGISTQRVDHTKLRFSQPEEVSSAQSLIAILDAQLERGSIRVLLEAAEEYLRDESALHVFIEQSGKRVECPHSLTAKEKVLRVDISKHLLVTDQAILLTIEFTSNQKTTSSRAWVSVPAALARNAEQRKLRDSINNAASYLLPSDDEGLVLAEALQRFFGGFLPTSSDAHGTSAKMAVQEDKLSEKDLSEEDFIILESDLGRIRQSAHRTLEHLSALAKLLHSLLIAQDESAPADVEEDDEAEAGSSEHPKAPEDGHKERVVGALAKATDSYFRTLNQALEQPINAITIPLIMNIPGAAVAFMKLHALVQEKCSLPSDHTFAYEMREALKSLLSIDGIVVGGTSGWLMQAMTSEVSRIQLQNLLVDERRRKDIQSMAMGGLTLEGTIKDDDLVALSILGGMEFLLGASCQTADSRAQEAGRERSGNVGDAPSKPESDTSKQIVSTLYTQVVRQWNLLLQLDAARKSREDLTGIRRKLEEVAPGLLEQYDDAQRKSCIPLARVYATASGNVGCGICGMVISPEEERHLRMLGRHAVVCRRKPHLLCPLDTASPLTAAVQHWVGHHGGGDR